MELLMPGLGLIFWMTIAFGLLLFVLGKFAWPAILKSLREREESIEIALNSANKAKEEMKALQFSNEKLLQEAKNERDIILRDARKVKEKMIEEAKFTANEEAERIVASASEQIHFEKMAAITDLKNQMANLSIEIAEKVLKSEMNNKESQKEKIEEMLKEVKLK